MNREKDNTTTQPETPQTIDKYKDLNRGTNKANEGLNKGVNLGV